MTSAMIAILFFSTGVLFVTAAMDRFRYQRERESIEGILTILQDKPSKADAWGIMYGPGEKVSISECDGVYEVEYVSCDIRGVSYWIVDGPVSLQVDQEHLIPAV